MNNELTDFLSLVAKGKKEAIEKNPGKKALKELKESLQSSNPFATLPILPKKVTLVENNTSGREVVGEFILEQGEYKYMVSEDVAARSAEVVPAADRFPMDQINRYLSQNATFQQPNPEKVDPNIRAIQDKLKMMEQWVSKIAASGPGSGEVNFRYLDDVNRSTMTSENDHWVLEYDAVTGDVKFTEDVGPIRTLALNTEGVIDPLVPGQLAYNPHEDCVDIRHEDGSTLQAGLEQHIRVVNTSQSTLTAGTAVGFGGVVEFDNDQLPVAVPYAAGVTALPLYVMGVLTTNILPGSVGRCTVFGKVRNLDTTGDSGLNETWNVGDLLWSHPTLAGRLTKVQPSSPYPAVSIAAVLKKNATDGVILVRPTIFPRLWFGRFRDFTNQVAAAINTPYTTWFGETAAASGFQTDSADKSKIIAEHTGQYKFDIRLQFTSANSSTSKIWVWYRVNGVDAAGTGTQYTISANGGIVVATLPYIISLNANDYVQIMWAADSTAISMQSPPATSFCPSTPSAVVAITQANL